MQLENIIADLPVSLTVPNEARALEVASITADSRKVAPGTLFAALRGVKVDGAAFAASAVAAGAVAVLAGQDAELPPLDVPVIRADDPRRALALIAARLAGAQPETLVAVTGTAGKTSVAVFVRQIFDAAGHHAASIGTIGTVTSRGAHYGGLTTPDPVSLHATLRDLARDGVTHAALEASSHGLDQRRLDGVTLKAAAFTNLGRDHLDYHPTVEDYLQAKLRLFDTLLGEGGTAVYDPGETYADRIAEIAKRRGLKTLTVGETGEDLKLVSVTIEGFHQRLVIEAAGRRFDVDLPLVGRFQVSNALIAAGLAIAAGVAADVAVPALSRLEGAPGRLERVGASDKGALVFVDYAHKPDALDNALGALRPYASGRLIVVVGCGGDRDKGKRPIMGEIATKRADVVIITDDNPRSENPAEIRMAMMNAAPGAMEIGDRGIAIHAAVEMLEAGDVLCIAGKGHETGQIVGDTVLPFSDHEAVLAALADFSRKVPKETLG
ncbi:UDP-N-acetylmuramoylalanyl-D-glutamate--2,6-diaminopimelate ligase [Breoghania corrubedonensis]|uniref:UDP-N-acetylmuramoyl-L-alanyl-D-glutamate--2,6-diaminopimelate ligase n=1 Tax=Breoghania corrubedonensis TaxID=665038 RepID=A0A2T5V503_9HYPH|nr:UDP-N-acetylmuramoyl-L-alanyl-D-glutamate--2,6-diaminopimelate ligase [Breoghania corrubedonensis]PTW58813.1 UDP-N-acetylmuramoylalanyl-D-glutamate--2,6-diaminopimelate ligase [Breoghania corrubedonensis]